MKEPVKKSPLERLSDVVQEQTLPVKVEPKNRFKKAKALTPVVEDTPDSELLNIDQELGSELGPGMVIANSSLNLHFNFNVDDKAVDKMIEGSKQALKGIAAAGAAMLGTAMLLGSNNKKVDKVKIPLTPKIKLPRV